MDDIDWEYKIQGIYPLQRYKMVSEWNNTAKYVCCRVGCLNYYWKQAYLILLSKCNIFKNSSNTTVEFFAFFCEMQII